MGRRWVECSGEPSSAARKVTSTDSGPFFRWDDDGERPTLTEMHRCTSRSNGAHPMTSPTTRLALQIAGRGRLEGHPPGEVDGVRFEGRFVIYALADAQGPLFGEDVSLFDAGGPLPSTAGGAPRALIWSPCGAASSSRASSRATTRSRARPSAARPHRPVSGSTTTQLQTVPDGSTTGRPSWPESSSRPTAPRSTSRWTRARVSSTRA